MRNIKEALSGFAATAVASLIVAGLWVAAKLFRSLIGPT